MLASPSLHEGEDCLFESSPQPWDRAATSCQLTWIPAPPPSPDRRISGKHVEDCLVIARLFLRWRCCFFRPARRKDVCRLDCCHCRNRRDAPHPSTKAATGLNRVVAAFYPSSLPVAAPPGDHVSVSHVIPTAVAFIRFFFVASLKGLCWTRLDAAMVCFRGAAPTAVESASICCHATYAVYCQRSER